MSPSRSTKLLSAWRGGWKSNTTGNGQCVDRRYGGRRTLANSNIAPAGTIDCFGLTDIGRVRERNEDQFLIANMIKPVALLHSNFSPGVDTDMQELLNANLLLVADGVGGNAGGERASRLAMEGIVEYLHNNQKRLFGNEERRGNTICEDLKSALAWAQRRIRREAESSPEHARMGTTLTLACLKWPTVYIAHVGDSRAYIYRRPELLQLTHDQTVAQMLADAGAIEADAIEHHQFRNVLCSLLNRDPRQLTPCVHKRQLASGDQLLLCTDGLTKHLAGPQIAEILETTYSAEEACHELIAAANTAGGTDNTTVVLARFGHREAETIEDPAISIEL